MEPQKTMEKGQATMPSKENKPKNVYKYEHQTVDEIMADLEGIANKGIMEQLAQDYEKDKAEDEVRRITDCLDRLYYDVVSPEICIKYSDDMVTVCKGTDIISETFVKCLTPAELIRTIAVDLDGEK